MSNIINFPKEKVANKENIPKSINEIKTSVDSMKHAHIQETITVITPMIFQQLAVAGFELIDDEEELSLKDGAFLVESIRSILYRYYDLTHPFQKIADSAFNIDDNGLLSIVNKLDLDLKEETEESE